MWCTFWDDWDPQWLALVQAFWGIDYGQTQKQGPRKSSRIPTRVWSTNAQTKEKRNNACSEQSNNLIHTSSPKIQKREHALFDLHTMRAKSTRRPKWKEVELNTNCRSNCCRVINGPSNFHTIHRWELWVAVSTLSSSGPWRFSSKHHYWIIESYTSSRQFKKNKGNKRFFMTSLWIS